MQRIRKIGISGYMGAGKSTVARFFQDKGYSLIDADQEAKLLYRNQPSIVQQLLRTFGDRVIENQELSFSKLGAVAFGDMENLKILNAIIHPPLLRRLHQLMELNINNNTVLDAALIPLWNIDSWFDVRIWVGSSRENRLKRLIQRSASLEESQIRSRIQMQQDLFDPPTENTWVIIENNGDMNSLENEIEQKMRRILEN